MAKAIFRLNKGLKTTNPVKVYAIYLRYRFGTADYNASIGFGVIPEHWDNDMRKAKEFVAVKDHEEINSLIKNLDKHFTDWSLENKRKGFKPAYNDIKRHYDSYYTISEDMPKQIELFDLIELFINQDHSLKRQKVTHGTVKTYMTTKQVLLDFQKYWGKLSFANIDLDFYFDFVDWCEKKKIYAINYIGKNIKNIITFMTYALENELTSNAAFKSKKFAKLSEDAVNIYLTLDELQAIWQLDLSENDRMDRARDLFLIGAFTGLRVSDFNNLQKHNIKTVQGVELINIPTQKTGEEVAVPLHPIVKAILLKREGNPPQRLADQTINELIKDVAESAGIDSIEYVTQTKGGKKLIIKKYKFELVKTHTARRSFCSNAYLSGMEPIDIMSISGHRTEKDFLRYIKLSKTDIAIKMSTNAFFTGATALKKVK